ncbi:tRNA(His) guanylyltransferase Thg1 family protein [Aureibacter tunicatorum]|uniref:tRNA(His) guanylyltransferase n=1 Tax=Aureibacter tunicatorum TaxID=866807 RepID=A0AAE3XLZ7_9BACT|nr:tRNA(His) guanylyltransferase Thg1 family protein [Aureibacter tunicatorum]MDR6238463.1 tRNA(His) 5'-end guanylyltransferase [Aureibacter tunicatorum]BDD05603.1 guanylyltransferase [Aureibacter tunicatorum]
MKFDDLDKTLRIYETSHDFCVPPNIYMVARIDGRGFTRLTKESHPFERPFDERFRDMMIETVKHLMTCGFKVIYGFTESDEISLLFDMKEDAFSRKLRKYNSILAGEASAKFSVMLGNIGAFDCRISQLPREQDVIDYFRWRNEDAHRNALNAHSYWMLRNKGQSAAHASKQIEGKSTAYKNELLFENGINFNELPSWQKRGIGFFWHEIEKTGWNPLKKEEVNAIRKEIKIDFEIPKGEAYNRFIKEILANNK